MLDERFDPISIVGRVDRLDMAAGGAATTVVVRFVIRIWHVCHMRAHEELAAYEYKYRDIFIWRRCLLV